MLQPIHHRACRYFLLHKPAGCLVTSKLPLDGLPPRSTVYDVLDRAGVPWDPNNDTEDDFQAATVRWPHLPAAGRLDMNTEGLILFTNDGHLISGQHG